MCGICDLSKLEKPLRVRLSREVKIAEMAERKAMAAFKKILKEYEKQALIHLAHDMPPPVVDFAYALMYSAYEAMDAAMRSLPQQEETEVKLSRLPAIRIPRTPKELRQWWDSVRTKKAPPRIMALEKQIRQKYVAKCQSIWEKASREWRTGDFEKQEQAKVKVRDIFEVVESRATMIVRTESTRYYNEVRRNYYDKEPTVTHYLFVSIRDKATTDWCKDRKNLVYTKGSALLKKETPPCFLGGTPILTEFGWECIEKIKVGDYVFTANGRWKRVSKIYNTSKRNEQIFQIGYGLATANHPFLCRDGKFVEAAFFSAQEGVCAISLGMPQLWQKTLDAIQQVQREKRMQCQMPCLDPSAFSIERISSALEWWLQKNQSWICWDIRSNKSYGEQTGICAISPLDNGKTFGEKIKTNGNCAPHRLEQTEQLYRESSIDVEFRSRCSSQKIGRIEPSNMQINVYNLEVEDDHTYCAGGFFVHNCHWNCRSQIVPLTPFSKEDKRIIDDESRRREKHKCKSLPKGWNE